MRYICELCGLVYDEAQNLPFSELPPDFSCPCCGSEKEAFTPASSGQSITRQPEPLDSYVKYAQEYHPSDR